MREIIRIIIGLCCIVLLCTACRGSEGMQKEHNNMSEHSSMEKNDKMDMKEVLFLNRIPEPVDKNASLTGFAGLYTMLEMDEKYTPQSLFAYQVEWDGKHSRQEVVTFLIGEGFFILQNNVDTELVVAGTMEQLERVFSQGQEYKGYLLGANAAIRPDMEEIIRQVYDDAANEEMYTKEWFDAHYEELVNSLETDKNRVTLTVPVIVPEETAE